jgi:hypothetical protein
MIRFGTVSLRLRYALAFVLVSLLCAAAASASDKKGVAFGLPATAADERLAALRVDWYYNWTVRPSSKASASCFVPMYWGRSWQLATLKQDLPQGTRDLLVYNEPDRSTQANRTVEEVALEWPRVASLGARMSAPAAKPFDGWMSRFMEEARARKLEIAFVPIHWYGAPDSRKFLQYVDRVHALYGLPVWITEFAVTDWRAKKYGTLNRFTEDDVIRFIEEVLPELERRSFVERYAWLTADTSKESLRPSLLITSEGKLTRVGMAYASYAADDGDAFPCPAFHG